MLPWLSGLAIGLAFGLSADSLFIWRSSDSRQKVGQEATYRGQPASFWIKQLTDRDSSVWKEAMWALATCREPPTLTVVSRSDLLTG
jgi:hypothetical protein